MSIAIITGASSGIGREYTKVLTEQAKYEEIWIIARRKQALVELTKIHKQQHFRIFCLDLALEESYEQIKQALITSQVDVSLLINCAGMGKICYFQQTDLESQMDMIKINCLALTALTKTVLPHMKAGAQIMNIASVAAFLPLPEFAVYSASKAYVMYFSQALNAELKQQKIHVLSVYPAPVKTAFFPLASQDPIPNMYNKMPQIDAQKVVRKSLKALAHHRDTCVVGYFSRTLQVISKIMPTKICLRFLEKWNRLF